MVFAAAIALSVSFLGVPCVGAGPGCTVQTQVNGRDARLVVDTGADLTVLTRQGARSLGVRVGPDSPYIVVRGVAGTSVAQLARATVSVGEFKEEDVLVAVLDELDLGGRAVGLLGMTYLERFRTRMGASLELEPIDANDRERRGGRGPTWWRLRFRQTTGRLEAYESMVRRAKEADREIEAAIGKSASGDSLEDMIRRLTEFVEDEQTKLRNAAARAAVPHEWRR